MDSEKKEAGSWWIWITFLLLFTTVVFGALNKLGIIGATVVERVVFENSFQYKEGMKQRAATLEANIAELDGMIAMGQGDTQALEAQRRVLRIQLNAMKE